LFRRGPWFNTSRSVTRKKTWRRRWLFALQNWARRTTLSQRFLLVASATIVAVSAATGFWVVANVQAGIVEGVARTAASGIQSLLYPSVSGLALDRDLTAEERDALARAFDLGNEADTTRLLQFDLRRLDGTLIYRADGGLQDDVASDVLARASAGEFVATVLGVLLPPIGPFDRFPLDVLRIVTPLSKPDGAPFAIATLYFSAKSLSEIETRVLGAVWLAVAGAGLLVLAGLYVMVNRASRTIDTQRRRLAGNLVESRRLTDENRTLHNASEQLRLDASSANESLLSRVGSDIHDGPVQLITLLILRLSGAKPERVMEAMEAALPVARQAIDELRDISSGLVLPELTSLNVTEAVQLAARRHEETTGAAVDFEASEDIGAASMAAKICAYRVTQEGLSNGFRHGGDGRQGVRVGGDGGYFELIVTNPPTTREQRPQPQAERLGLRGLRFRVEALGGSIAVEFGETTTTLRAWIPLTSPQALPPPAQH
jgi:signal transduction histidine kinase